MTSEEWSGIKREAAIAPIKSRLENSQRLMIDGRKNQYRHIIYNTYEEVPEDINDNTEQARLNLLQTSSQKSYNVIHRRFDNC